jgi:hypothetical protein
MGTPVKVLAEEFVFEIGDGGGGFLEIKGLDTFSLDPSDQDTDTSDFQSGGFDESMIGSRGLAITLDGKYLIDPADGTEDPGQARVKAVALLTGRLSVVPFRVTDPANGTETFNGTVSRPKIGGKKGERVGWSTTVKRSGASS